MATVAVAVAVVGAVGVAVGDGALVVAARSDERCRGQHQNHHDETLHGTTLAVPGGRVDARLDPRSGPTVRPVSGPASHR